MDARKVIGVDLDTTPKVERRAAAEVSPTQPRTQPVAEFATPRWMKRLSVGWAAAMFAAAAVAILVIELVAAGADPDVVPPTGLMLAAIESVGLVLLATPLLALARTRTAAIAGAIGGLGVLGFQAECFFGGHTGFFAGPFMAVNVAMLGLVAVSVAALTRR